MRYLAVFAAAALLLGAGVPASGARETSLGVGGAWETYLAGARFDDCKAMCRSEWGHTANHAESDQRVYYYCRAQCGRWTSGDWDKAKCDASCQREHSHRSKHLEMREDEDFDDYMDRQMHAGIGSLEIDHAKREVVTKFEAGSDAERACQTACSTIPTEHCATTCRARKAEFATADDAASCVRLCELRVGRRSDQTGEDYWRKDFEYVCAFGRTPTLNKVATSYGHGTGVSIARECTTRCEALFPASRTFYVPEVPARFGYIMTDENGKPKKNKDGTTKTGHKWSDKSDWNDSGYDGCSGGETAPLSHACEHGCFMVARTTSKANCREWCWDRNALPKSWAEACEAGCDSATDAELESLRVKRAAYLATTKE